MPAPPFTPLWPAYTVRFLDSGADPIHVQLRDGDIWRTEQQTGISVAKFNLGDPEFTLPATWHALRRMGHPNIPEFEQYVDLVDVTVTAKDPDESEGELGKDSALDPPTGSSPPSP